MRVSEYVASRIRRNRAATPKSHDVVALKFSSNKTRGFVEMTSSGRIRTGPDLQQLEWEILATLAMHETKDIAYVPSNKKI